MKTEIVHGKNVIYLEGEINAKTGGDYKVKVIELFSTGDVFALSFKDVVYLNSSGLREIIDLLKTATSSRKELRLFDMSKDIREMFSFTGLDRVFKIYDSKNAVLA